MNPHKDRYCFIHLQKSGGLSILHFLRSALGERNVLHTDRPGAHAQAPLEYLMSRYQAVVGHFAAAELSRWMFENIFLFTFLRDPLDRVLSHYYFFRNLQHDWNSRDLTRAKEMDLRKILETTDFSLPSIWSNYQTAALSAIPPHDVLPGATLTSAKSTLDQLDFVGFNESLHEDMRAMSELCGWTKDLVVPAVNITPRRPPKTEIDRETLRLIENLNGDDIALYQYARSLERRTVRPRLPNQGQCDRLSDLPPGVFLRAERGNMEVFVQTLTVQGRESAADLIPRGEQVEIRITGESKIVCPELVVGIRITNTLGFELYGTNTLLLDHPIALRRGEIFSIIFTFPAVLSPGKYYITVALHSPDGRNFHWVDNHSLFQIFDARPANFVGQFDLQAQVSVQRTDNETPVL